MKNRLSLLLALSALILLASCKVEEEKEQLYSKDPVDLTIGTRASVNPTLPDSRVDRLRVLAFDAAGQCQSNELYDFKNTSLTSPFIHTMRPGLYTFVFIANEPAANTGTLSAIKIRSALNAVTFAASAFDREVEIPMLKEYTGVEVLSTQKVKVGGIEYSTWTISLERLAVRVDLVLKSVVDWDGTFTGVKFENLPDYVPLFGNYAEATHSTQSAYTLLDTASDDTDGIRDLTTAEIAAQVAKESDFTTKYAWTKKIERIILPSCLFSPITNDTRALKFTILLGNHTPSTLIGHNKPSNYTLQPNTNYLGELDIERPEADLALELQAVNWDDVIINGNSYRQLNVSHIETLANNWAVTRVYFWSDQREVTVEKEGYVGNTMTPFTVDTFFDDIAESGSANTVYNPTTGQGYIDLHAIHTTPGSYTRRIMLNAGGLKREITVNTRILTPPVAWASTPYVGTFHRKTETGERVIMGDHSGTWTASVDDPTGSGSFVNLSLDYTEDPNWYTNSPGNPENYPVVGTQKTITGKGKIFFRVGLNGTTPANRYATITVTHSSGISKLYVRQGEDPDYLMRPDDHYDGAYVAGSNARPLSAKYSPYNLTVPSFNGTASTIGSESLTVRGGVFTKYPTQAGALFQFAPDYGLYAFNSGAPVSDPANYQLGYHASIFWNTLAATHETCPANYRRPHHGSTAGYQITVAITDSEMEQSLYYSTPVNWQWGFYADGYFDRRIIDSQPATVTEGPSVAVAINTSDVAHVGRLFYNPNNNAALFFPLAGLREAINGGGYIVGHLRQGVGCYWTTSVANAHDAWFLEIRSGVIVSHGETHAMSIRCVAE